MKKILFGLLLVLGMTAQADTYKYNCSSIEQEGNHFSDELKFTLEIPSTPLESLENAKEIYISNYQQADHKLFKGPVKLDLEKHSNWNTEFIVEGLNIPAVKSYNGYIRMLNLMYFAHPDRSLLLYSHFDREDAVGADEFNVSCVKE
ncbi:MAG: hypothetical protein ACXVB1_15820 [Pseudobdellovibrionaceae bacterium]